MPSSENLEVHLSKDPSKYAYRSDLFFGRAEAVTMEAAGMRQRWEPDGSSVILTTSDEEPEHL
jgi:hypothetical protein